MSAVDGPGHHLQYNIAEQVWQALAAKLFGHIDAVPTLVGILPDNVAGNGGNLDAALFNVRRLVVEIRLAWCHDTIYKPGDVADVFGDPGLVPVVQTFNISGMIKDKKNVIHRAAIIT